MALIDSGNIGDGINADRRMSEHEWTLLMLKHGYAELAEPHRDKIERGDASGEPPSSGEPPAPRSTKSAGGTVAAPESPAQLLQAEPEPSSEGLSARRARVGSAGLSRSPRPAPTQERRHSLDEMAERLTTKRRYRRKT